MYKITGGVPPEPLRVSPLIRVSRWTLLGLGVAWGAHRFSTLKIKETKIREQRDRERPAKLAARAVEQAKIFAEQERELMAGGGPPATS